MLYAKGYHVILNGESSSCLNTALLFLSSPLTVVACFTEGEVIFRL